MSIAAKVGDAVLLAPDIATAVDFVRRVAPGARPEPVTPRDEDRTDDFSEQRGVPR